jgi:CCR4-NOT transcription complex subunit 7/8
MAAAMSYDSALAPWAQLGMRTRYETLMAPRFVPGSRDFHEVWANNFEVEFKALIAAVSRAGGPDSFLALDMEFPGFPCQDPQFSTHSVHYQALRHNVDQLWPIQFGVAVVGASGVYHGVWTFNLRFDASVDAHTEESLAFLRKAGLDFDRHRTEGVEALDLGQRLANSILVGPHGQGPCWVTFSGSYDWGYLLKLVTKGRPLPGVTSTFDKVLAVYCPKRRELRDMLPKGSLDALGRRHGVKRLGSAHTAGSDALLTLELFMLLGGSKLLPDALGVFDKLDEAQQQDQWAEVASEVSWPSADDWYPSDSDQWYAGNGRTAAYSDSSTDASEVWGAPDSSWASQSQTNNHWFSTSAATSEYSSGYSGYSPTYGSVYSSGGNGFFASL